MRTLNVGFRTESFGPFSYLFERIPRQKYDFDLKPMPKFGSGEQAEDSILGGELAFVLTLDEEGFIDRLAESR